MRFEIEHRLNYTYSREVFLEPTSIRLKPRADFSQSLESFELKVDPGPQGLSETLDLYNNHEVLAWFAGKHSHFNLTVRSRVSTLLDNPFHYLITDPLVLHLPARYGPDQAGLTPYLKPAPDPSVVNLAQDLLKESDDNALNFLFHATDHIHREFQHVARPQGDALPAHKTLKRREGACRDLAVLLVDVCRAMGLAARFVSGYKFDPGSKDAHDLHAWTEIYLPGAGWRGYDPSWGLAVSDLHIPIAAGPSPTEAAAVSGTFRGSDALSKLDYQVEIRNLEPSSKSNAVL
ncbi:MAG TPA: transglutaminase family protein [bacterium]|nr:transglutaminase family protein [bacterium]